MAIIKKSKRNINLLIVHCTATVEGRDYTVKDVDRWHRSQGWDCIGYHYLIYRDGTVANGRDVDKVGAHCSGWNRYSIGICYVGGLAKDGKTAKDTRTDEQKDAIIKLLRQLKALYPKAVIRGHRDLAAKACPSFNAKEEYKGL